MASSLAYEMLADLLAKLAYHSEVKELYMTGVDRKRSHSSNSVESRPVDWDWDLLSCNTDPRISMEWCCKVHCRSRIGSSQFPSHKLLRVWITYTLVLVCHQSISAIVLVEG